VQAEYHLSLSRTVAVRAHQIQPLLADLRAGLSGTPRRALPYPPPTPPPPPPLAFASTLPLRLAVWRCIAGPSSEQAARRSAGDCLAPAGAACNLAPLEPLQRAPTLRGLACKPLLGSCLPLGAAVPRVHAGRAHCAL